MIRFLNFIKKEPVGAVTWIDRALEMVALVLGIFLVVLSIVVYLKAPQQVPVHFNAAGEINERGDKAMVFVPAGLGIVSMAICNAAAYNYKMVNLPIRLNPKCLPRQVTLIGRMSRILSILCGLLFIVLLLLTNAPQWNTRTLCPFLFVSIMAGFFITITIYTLLIYKVGRRYG